MNESSDFLLKKDSYIYIYMKMVQITPSVSVILLSYTFSKPLDLNRSNGQKRYLLMVIF